MFTFSRPSLRIPRDADETQQERERGVALSKVAHNEYFMRNLALNLGRETVCAQAIGWEK